MNLITNLNGRLRNTKLSKSHGLMPLFEAVVNSIHSTEEAELTPEKSFINIEILHIKQGNLKFHSDTPEIIGFKITDNGIGFNDKNMKSFETLDSDYKIDKGCRGIGRLLWLKAFSNVRINSIYYDNSGEIKAREFEFNKHGINNLSSDTINDKNKIETIVYLEGFLKEYRDAVSKSIKSVANSLFEHCLWYFIREKGAPKITIFNESESIDLLDIYKENLHSHVFSETIKIKGKDFKLIHAKIRSKAKRQHVLAYCASNRLVTEEKITGKLPGLFGTLQDKKGAFVYACYLSSIYLDERVYSERTGFDISETIENMFSKTEISLCEIREKTLVSSQKYLCESLDNNISKGRDRIDQFISDKAPHYQSIISHIENKSFIVDPSATDKKIELFLHQKKIEIERKLLEDGHQVIDSYENNNLVDYQERLKNYLQMAADIKQANLVNYVVHRKIVLDILEKVIQAEKAGKYVKESLVHEMLIPMGKSSDEIDYNSNNLWIIDERLVFHNYLASDKTINSMPITDDKSNRRPDICSLRVYENPLLISEKQTLPLASITIIEIKRPMRNDSKDNPIKQALTYLKKIREGNVETANGRLIPESANIPGFCYVISDLTPSIKEQCELFSLDVSSDYMGYFGYIKHYKAFVEVISYDKLINTAKERNRAFFEKLGLSSL